MGVVSFKHVEPSPLTPQMLFTPSASALDQEFIARYLRRSGITPFPHVLHALSRVVSLFVLSMNTDCELPQ